MKAIIAGGVGSTSAAISGMITTAPTNTVCAMIDNGSTYHFLLPSLTDGFDDIAEHVTWHESILLGASSA